MKLKLIILEAAGDLPRDPVGPPSLIADESSERAGQFITDLSGAAPQPQRRERVHTAVTFLFRIEEMTTHNVSYIWTVSAVDSEFQIVHIKYRSSH